VKDGFGSRRDEHMVLLALAAFVLFLFPDVLFRGRVLYERDVHLIWYSQVESFVRAVRSGSWPLWDPHLSFGHPMLANANAQVLYPPTWLNLVMAPESAYVVYVMLHLAFSAAGLFHLARALGLGRAAAATGAAIWTASGPLLSLVNVWNHLAGAAWLPWVFLAVERALAKPGLRAGTVLGFALGLQFLAGSPDLAAFTGLSLVAYVAARASALPEVRKGLRSRLLTLAAALGLAAGLSTGLLLPAVESAHRGVRWSFEADRRTVGSLHPLAVPLKMLSPAIFWELPLQPTFAEPLLDSGLPLLRSLYLGLPALALVLAGLAGRPRPARGFLAALGGAALLFALGRHSPFHAFLVGLVPPLGLLRHPSKVAVLVAFAWALVAAMGVDTWRSPLEGRRRWLLGVSLPFGALALLEVVAAACARDPGPLLGAHLIPESVLGFTWSDAFARVAATLAQGALLSLLVMGLSLWRVRGRGAEAWSAVAVAILAVGDLWLANHAINRTVPREFYRYRPPLVDAVGPGTRVLVHSYDPTRPQLPVPNPYMLDRYPAGLGFEAGLALGARLYLLPPLGGAWGLFGSYDPDLLGLYPWHLEQLVRAQRQAEGTPVSRRLLELGSVEYVASLHEMGLDGLDPVRELPSPLRLPIRLYRLRDPLPRTYAVGRAQHLDGPSALATLQDPAFDPRREVVLASVAPHPDAPTFSASSTIVGYQADRVRIEATLSHAGYVVLVDSYDPGWTARVDGREAPVLRANVAFRAVPVPAGRHLIELTYRPRSVLAGLTLSGVALLLGVAALVASRRWQ
jgi:hypothetical protein